MIILGLHFGHDAGVAVLRDGQVVTCVIRERQTRVKHAMTLDVGTIRRALKDAGVTSNQIDFCAITSTQGVELIVDRPEDVSIALRRPDQADNVPCTMTRDGVPALSRRVLLNLFTEEHSDKSAIYTKRLYSKYLPEYKDWEGKEKELCGWIDEYVYDDLWCPPKTLKALSTARLSPAVRSESLRYGFHYPASISLQGCILPAFFINHHACHAASSYYQSGFNAAAVFSQDGGSGIGYDSGMFYYGEENRLYPIAPHHSILGVVYDLVAFLMNLGESSAGKLMGLSAYGKPAFYDRTFLGTRNDLINLTREVDLANIVEHWLYHCLSLARDLDYDLEPFGDTARMTAPINIDIAASTQKWFEENALALTGVLHSYLGENGIAVDNLCLSGGAALNCPSNSRIVREGRFKNVFVEPGCDDSGLAVGAALNCHYNLLDQPLPKKSSRQFVSPFLGPRVEKLDVLSAIECFKKHVQFEQISDLAVDAAHELEKNRVIGWFYGRSEIGPRALGHRSILADPRDVRNWERVNKIKKRELWRPFAPAVLESEAEKWFSGIQLPSPYMLFNATVKSKYAPAITHVDGSARVQTVNENEGAFYNLLVEFFRITKVPILLNTSFNGPGEAIVETPLDALTFFIGSELDVLYLDSYKVKHRTAGKPDVADRNPTEISRATTFNVHKFIADIEKGKIQRQTVYFLVEAGYKGFSIVVYNGHFVGLRHGIPGESQMLGLEALQASYGSANVIVCESVEAARAQIDQMRGLWDADLARVTVVPVEVFKPIEALSTPPIIESRHGFNLVSYRGKVWMVDQSAGAVDFRDQEQLKCLAATGHFLEVKTLGEARAAVDQMRKDEVSSPHVVESRNGFNIVSYKGKSWVVDQSVGRVDFLDQEQLQCLVADGVVIEVETLSEARTLVDKKIITEPTAGVENSSSRAQ
jgi:carbamoyltransferase